MIESAGLFGESVLQITDIDHKDGSTANITNIIDNQELQIEGVTKLTDGNLAFMYKGATDNFESTSLAYIDLNSESSDIISKDL